MKTNITNNNSNNKRKRREKIEFTSDELNFFEECKEDIVKACEDHKRIVRKKDNSESLLKFYLPAKPNLLISLELQLFE